MKSSNPNKQKDGDAPNLITTHIQSFTDWRGPVLARVRALIHQACPYLVEAWKWRVWTRVALIARRRLIRRL
jgi:hypothetical protein